MTDLASDLRDTLFFDEDGEWGYMTPLPGETPDAAIERCRVRAKTDYGMTMVGPITCSDAPRRYAQDHEDDPNPRGILRPVAQITTQGGSTVEGTEVRLWVFDLTELEAA